MRTNLTSLITLNKVSTKFYKPGNDYERALLTRYERVQTQIVENQNEAARQIADDIVARLRKKQKKNETFVLTLPCGTAVKPICDELVERYVSKKVSFRNLVFFNQYELFPFIDGSNYGLENIKSMLLDHIDILPENVHTFDNTISVNDVAAECKHYEETLEEVGGLDYAVTVIGRNGNIGYNEPGSSINSMTRMILLDDTSLSEISKTFGKVSDVPRSAIIMGVKTLLSARKIVTFSCGEENCEMVRKVVEEKVVDTLPASYVQTHNDATCYVDLDAASHLTRIRRPWLVASCDWTDKLIRSAIVWLCSLVEKPILKLTNKDYNEHGLGELLALYGSAYNVNIKVFNDLQHTITGWPGGKPNADDSNRPERALPYPKRVIVFSPHPDDDVISMGGTVHRLASQGHDVHIAYQTSGNIAVDDEEVRRFMMFVKGYNKISGLNDNRVEGKYAEVIDFLNNKKGAEGDNRDVLDIKALIRRGEARTACAYAGIKRENIHFLNLPFYETGKIEKKPISMDDVQIVLDLLRSVEPNQIFVAGDLADPHGTHKVCTDAVLAAIDVEKSRGAEWLKNCRIWMYRGAWAEWEIENIQMAVPMSPEELRFKRNTILKHQSQMEGAPFLGNDERLFWQRSEDRNRATASLYNSLGLASYEAIEAFVEYVPID